MPGTVERQPQPDAENVSKASSASTSAEGAPARSANKYFERSVEKPFFNKEGVREQDLQSLGRELKELFLRGEYQVVTRQLAHLKRAGVELKGKSREDAEKKLLAATEELKDKPDQLASYLTHLKFLGFSKEPTEEQQTIISQALQKRLAQNQVDGLSELCIYAKYLGVQKDYQDMRPYLQAELKRLQKQSGNEYKQVRHLARMKYLGLEYAVGNPSRNGSSVVEGENVKDIQGKSTLDTLGITERLQALRKEGRWPQYLQLRLAADSLRGPSQFSIDEEKGLLQALRQQASRAREFINWTPYAVFAGHIAAASKFSVESKRPSADMSTDKYGAQVVRWLEEGTDQAESSTDKPLRKWSEIEPLSQVDASAPVSPDIAPQAPTPETVKSEPTVPVEPTFEEQYPQRAQFQKDTEQFYQNMGFNADGSAREDVSTSHRRKQSWWERFISRFNF